MPEQYKPYTSKKALNEAELMRQKMAENEKLNYAEAEREIELEKVIESAKNGELAEKIRDLDLSVEDDVEKLRIYLKPWYYHGSKLQKILNSSGVEIFQSEHNISYILDVFHKGYFNKLRDSSLEQRVNCYGHEISKSAMYYLKMSNMRLDLKKALESENESDKFFATVGVMASFTATSMNGGLPGSFMDVWGAKNNNGEITKKFIAAHPNYQGLMDMAQKADYFFKKLFEIFTKFLSNKIQNSGFKLAGKNSNITVEQIISDYDLSKKIFNSVFKRNWENVEKEALKAELSESVAEQTRMFTEKIEQYQKVLDEFDERLEYAKPQVKDKE